MTPLETLLAQLPNVKKAGNGWSARCPAHDDRRASLSIAQGDDGTALLKCHAGCDTMAILAAVGMKLADLFPAKVGPTPTRNGRPAPGGRAFATARDAVAELERRHGKRSALWTYHDAQGEPYGVVVRWDSPNGKDIRPVSRHADGWRVGAMREPRPLYRLPDLEKASRIVVTEGEKAAEAARSIGFVATTSSGGSQAATKTDWRPLAGKEVWVCPDNDPPGRRYADAVAAILGKLNPAAVVRIVELPGLPEAGDLVDWIDVHGDAAEPAAIHQAVEELAKALEPVRPEDAPDLTFRPFPVEQLPEPIRGFVLAGARSIGCDVTFLAVPLLVALAAAIGSTRRLLIKRGWAVPAILWASIIGESGTAKTPALRLVIQPIRERQTLAFRNYEKELAEYEAAKATDDKDKQPPPVCERFVVQDTTLEALAPILNENPRGLVLVRDELATWFGSFDRYVKKGKVGSDVGNWLSMYSGEPITVDRRSGVPRTIYVPHAVVSVVGGIQPAILRGALSEENRKNGLAARLLLAFPPRKAKRWTEADIDPQAEDDLACLMGRLYGLEPIVEGEVRRPALVRLTPEAKAVWIAYYNAHAQEQTDLTGDLAAAWSKLEEVAARLALVLHLTRWAADQTAVSPDLVDEASMRAGIALTTWFKHEAKRVYAMLSESDEERDERRLVDWIGRKGGTVTPREVQQGCRWLKEPGAAESALEELAKAGRGSWRAVPTTAKGGRPARAFVLSAPSTVHETPAKPEESEGSVDVDDVDDCESEAPAGDGKGGLFGNAMPAGPYRDGF